MAQVGLGPVHRIEQPVGGEHAGYTLGYFTRRANATGAWIGWAIGNVVLFFVWQYTGLNPWLFGPVGIASCFVGDYLASLVFKGASEVRGLTAFTISPPSSDM